MIKLRRTKADELFSLYVRHRDNYTCQRCKLYVQPPTNEIHCAHYHSRAKRSVRFDEENAIALCRKCHLYFDGNSWLRQDSHKEDFYLFMLNKLGQKRFNTLMFRANTPAKVDEKLICIWLEDKLKSLGIRYFK